MQEDVYDRFKHYDKEYSQSTSSILFPPDLYSRIRENVKGDILDIGTGDGYKLKNIIVGCNLKDVNKIVAIDPSPLYERVIQRFKNIEIKVVVYNSSLEDLPENEKFDTILMFEILEHVSDHNVVIDKVKKLLKPGGILICSTPNKFIFNVTEKLTLKPADKTHISEMTYRDFKHLMDTNFQITDYYGLLPIMRIGRKFPKLLCINRYLGFVPMSKALYCFAQKPNDGIKLYNNSSTA